MAEGKAAVQDFSSSATNSFKQVEQAAKSAGENGLGGFGGGLNQIVGLITGVKGEVGEVSDGFRSFGEILQNVAPALTGLLGVASLGGLYELANSASESAREIENMATAIGATTDQFEGFQFALASVGANTETANGALAKMLAFLGTADEALRKVADGANALAEAQQVQAERADLSARAAHDSASAAYSAYQQTADGITKAQVAADKAAISYDALRQKFKDSGAQGQTLRVQNIQLADSAAAFKTATEGIAAAQQRAYQASTNVANAQARAKIADDDRRATLDKLSEAQDKGTTAVQRWVESLGVASADLSEAGTNGTEAFFKIIQGLHDTTDAAQRAEYARAIFGRGWISLIPAIAAGGDKLKAFSQEFEETGLGLEKNAFEAAGAFEKARGQLAYFIEAIRNYLGTKVANIFAPMIQATADFIAHNAKQIKEWADGFSQAIEIVVLDFKALVALIGPPLIAAFQGITAVADGFAKVINKVFGSELTGPTLIFLTLFAGIGAKMLPAIAVFGRLLGVASGITPAFRLATLALNVFVAGGVGPAITALNNLIGKGTILGAIIALVVYNIANWETQWQGLTDAANGFWILIKALTEYIATTVVQGFALFMGDIQNGFNAVKDYIGSWITWFEDAVSAVGKIFSGMWNGAISYVEGLWNGLYDWIAGVFEKIGAWFDKIFAWIKSAADGIAGLFGGNAGSATGWQGGAVHAAGGGRISGPGTATSDSVPAMLSDGEFVINTGAAQRVGYGFLHALNSGTLAMHAMGGMIKMALGGLVGAPQRFADGGYVAAGTGNPGGASIVHLHLGGNTFSLMGERGVVNALQGAARKAGITATGRAPSWKR